MRYPLHRYREIVEQRASARYLFARSVPVGPLDGLSLHDLWKLHGLKLEECRELVQGRSAAGPSPDVNLMDLKRTLACRILSACAFCERDCGADRNKERGYCGVLSPRVVSAFLHMGEEEPLIPSYTIFFAGCNLRCAFCQNYDISTRPDAGREVPAEELTTMIEGAKASGTRNINWVGGDPTPDLHYVLDVLRRSGTNIAQVWNSNMYMSEGTLSLLDGVIDVYLTDLKFGNDECARRLSDAADYMRVVTRNHLMAASQCEIIVRHLMLPGHLMCCTIPALDWLADSLPGALVNVMAQYRPEHRAMDFPELRGRVRRVDLIEAIEHARHRGLRLA